MTRMEASCESKPALSFGISSILGVTNLHKHLRTNHHGDKRAKSAFTPLGHNCKREITAGQTTNSEVHSIFRHHNDHKSSANITGSVDTSEFKSGTTTVNNIAFGGNLSKERDNSSLTIGLPNLINSSGSTPNTSGLLMKTSEHTPLTGLVTGAALMPFVTPAEFTTQNYLLKSLETLRPKNYGMYTVCEVKQRLYIYIYIYVPQF